MIKNAARRFVSLHVSSEDLVAHADGYLTGQRRGFAEEHLGTCPRCRERLRAFEDVDRLVQTSAPLIDDPVGRAALRARLAAADQRIPAPRERPPARALVVASSLLLLLALVAWPLASEAGFPFAGVAYFDAMRHERSDDTRAPTALTGVAPQGPVAIVPAFRAVEPEILPLGLARSERSVPSADRLQQLYRNGAGLAVLLTQVGAASEPVRIDSAGEHAIATVRGIHVLFLGGPDPEAVAAALWEQDGVVFDLLVTEAPADGLARADAERLVEALMAAQDAAGR